MSDKDTVELRGELLQETERAREIRLATTGRTLWVPRSVTPSTVKARAAEPGGPRPCVMQVEAWWARQKGLA